MNDLSQLVPIVAGSLGMAPSTLLLLIGLLHVGAKVVSRLIPNDATGWRAQLRDLCSFIGADVSSRVTAGVTVQDVARQAITPPADKPVVEKIADEKGVSVAEVTPADHGDDKPAGV